MKRLLLMICCLMCLVPALSGAEMIQVGDVLIPIDKAVPLTGDSAPVLLWVGLALISVAGVVELRRRLS